MNIVDIQLQSTVPGVGARVHHNGTFIKTVPADGQVHRLELATQSNQNVIMIDHNSDNDIELDSIAMFGLGADRLRYMGTHCTAGGHCYQSHVITPGSTWTLPYQYPVFSWLHTVLNFGWLIQPDTV